jgi:hypothetical protein
MFPWPENYASAISLTFDDGYPSHLDFVVPNLDRRGLRATFYLTPQGSESTTSPRSWRRVLKRWLPVSRAGHEIGNHSLTHPCSLNIQVDWAANLLDMTLDDIRADLETAQERLRTVFPHQEHTSFAYPCYETSVGHGLERVSYIPLVARMFVAGRRSGELRGELANDPRYCDLHCLSSWCVERQAGATMIGLVEQTAVLGRWGIFTFHGIHEGHLPVGDTDLVELLDHLVRQRQRIWVAPVAEIAVYIAAHKVGLDES